MKRSELTDKLNEMDPDAEVVIQGFDGTVFDIGHLRWTNFKEHDRCGMPEKVVAMELVIFGLRPKKGWVYELRFCWRELIGWLRLLKKFVLFLILKRLKERKWLRKI